MQPEPCAAQLMVAVLGAASQGSLESISEMAWALWIVAGFVSWICLLVYWRLLTRIVPAPAGCCQNCCYPRPPASDANCPECGRNDLAPPPVNRRRVVTPIALTLCLVAGIGAITWNWSAQLNAFAPGRIAPRPHEIALAVLIYSIPACLAILTTARATRARPHLLVPVAFFQMSAMLGMGVLVSHLLLSRGGMSGEVDFPDIDMCVQFWLLPLGAGPILLTALFFAHLQRSARLREGAAAASPRPTQHRN